MMIDIGLATCAALPQLDDDNQILLSLLQKRSGLKVQPLIWNDPGVDWSQIKLTMIRSTWDYYHHLNDYLVWTHTVEQHSKLMNSAAVVAWNCNKTYLKELAQRGVPIVETQWFSPGSSLSLDTLFHDTGWESCVIKPSVSASGSNTFKVERHAWAEGQTQLDALLATHDMMIQPFIASIATEGELSFLFINNTFQHAVIKRPAPKEFRVQEHFGGQTLPYTPTPNEIQIACQVIKATPFDTLYARVDMVYDDQNRLCLSELEIIEPSLFLKHSPPTAEFLADTLCSQLSLV